MKNDKTSGVFSAVGMAAFAGGWWFGGIYTATALLMGIFTAQVVVLKLLRKPLPPATLAVWALVVVLGGLTLLLRDKTYIQLKTTVVYSLFGTALIVADFAFRKNLPKLALESFFNAPDAVWRKTSTALALFFYALAACNLAVAKYMSEGAWVGIKTFAFPAATFVFIIVLVLFLAKYAKENIQ